MPISLKIARESANFWFFFYETSGIPLIVLADDEADFKNGTLLSKEAGTIIKIGDVPVNEVRMMIRDITEQGEELA